MSDGINDGWPFPAPPHTKLSYERLEELFRKLYTANLALQGERNRLQEELQEARFYTPALVPWAHELHREAVRLIDHAEAGKLAKMVCDHLVAMKDPP